MRQKLIELWGEKEESTITAGDFKTPLSKMDKSSRVKISMDIIKLNNTISQLNVTDICTLLHPTVAEFLFLSGSQGTFTEVLLYLVFFFLLFRQILNVKEVFAKWTNKLKIAFFVAGEVKNYTHGEIICELPCTIYQLIRLKTMDKNFFCSGSQ